MKLLIIADDFTGALDTGVQLSKKHIPTTVFADIETLPEVPNHCEVLVINANIRHVSPESAYQCICTLLDTYAAPDTKIYLKTDSVLRGNISAVFAAALHTIKKPLCFVPAFPSLKRTTRNATAYVNGSLLEDSVFRDDPRTPTRNSYIPYIMNVTHSVQYECISIENQKTFQHSEHSSNIVYLFDCETNEQMTSIGNLIAKKNLFRLTAGCAGFAATFPDHLPFLKTPSTSSVTEGPVLFISGSANAVTLRQLQYAKDKNHPLFSLSETMFSNINDSTISIKDKGFYKDLRFENTLKKASSALLHGQSIILATAVEKSDFLNLGNIKKILKTDEAIHNYIAEYTSCLVESILKTVSIHNLVIFGGDMVAAILKKLSCHQVEALGEIKTGVPLCRISLNGTACNLATKSGGFGDEDIIPVIEQYFKNQY